MTPTDAELRTSKMRELHLFAGAGGGILGGMLLGHTPVCAVEIDDYCRRVLRARQADGWLPADMEIHDDVTTFDGLAWRGRVDVLAGGFPCQDLSLAGKGAGLSGERSGLWFEMLRVIREVRPNYVFVENVPAITGRGMDRVLGSLAEAGYDAEWLCLPASAVGAAHRRDRWWCLARNTNGTGAKPAKPGVRQGAVTDPVRVSEAVSDSSSVQLVCELGGNTAELPDSSSGQDHGRGRAELASAPQAGQGGDSAAGTGGAHDSDADRRGQQERGACELHRWCDAPRGDADRLREGRRGQMADANDAGRAQQRCAEPTRAPRAAAERGGGRQVERGLGRVADGLASWLDLSAGGFWQRDWETEPRLTQGQVSRVARLRAIGNGQVPQCAAAAFRELWNRLHDISQHVAAASGRIADQTERNGIRPRDSNEPAGSLPSPIE